MGNTLPQSAQTHCLDSIGFLQQKTWPLNKEAFTSTHNLEPQKKRSFLGEKWNGKAVHIYFIKLKTILKGKGEHYFEKEKKAEFLHCLSSPWGMFLAVPLCPDRSPQWQREVWNPLLWSGFMWAGEDPFRRQTSAATPVLRWGKRVRNYSLPALLWQQEGTRSTPTGQQGPGRRQGGISGEGALSSRIFLCKALFHSLLLFWTKMFQLYLFFVSWRDEETIIITSFHGLSPQHIATSCSGQLHTHGVGSTPSATTELGRHCDLKTSMGWRGKVTKSYRFI